MSVDPDRVTHRFLERAVDDPDWARDETEALEAYNAEHGARYGDDPLAVTLSPKPITPSQRTLLETGARDLAAALDTVVDVLVDQPELVDWGIDDQHRRLFEVDPGYRPAAPIARFDGFLDGQNLQFLEFNTDSPAGPGYADVVQRAFEALVDRNPQLGEGLELPALRRLDRLADTLTDCYTQWRAQAPDERPADPVIVAADWRDVSSRPDIDLTVEHLRKAGLDARFADPRDLELDGDTLVHDGDRVSLVYKRVIVDELLEKEHARALAHAYEAGTVCMVNPPRSVLAGDKRVMAALTWDEIQSRLTALEREAIERFVPWTRILQPGTTTIEGLEVNLRDLLLANQDEFVLKAAVSYGGRDVALGRAVDEETWGQLVDEHIKSGDWVAQRIVDLPEAMFPRVEDGDVRLRSLNVNVNPFVFGGAYAGSYTRVSGDDVINVAAGGGLAPTVELSPDGARP